MTGQNVDRSRYALIPRTLCFLVDQDRVLLLRLAESKGDWAGLYNGVGGHVERGESPLESCRREVLEETGLEPRDLKLCGVATVDAAEDLGVGLYVFVGQAQGDTVTTAEGRTAWFAIDKLKTIPTVDDVPSLLPKALACYREQAAPFVAHISQPAGQPPSVELS